MTPSDSTNPPDPATLDHLVTMMNLVWALHQGPTWADEVIKFAEGVGDLRTRKAIIDEALKYAKSDTHKKDLTKESKRVAKAAKMEKLLSFHLISTNVLGLPEDTKVNRFFKVIELAAFVLPAKARKESFEPMFEEEKEDYLKMRRKFKGQAARAYLAFAVCLHTGLIILQSLGAFMSEKFKKALWAAFGGLVMWYRGH